MANLAFERGGIVAVVALVVYVWLAPSHIVDGDNAEFATLGMLGGVAHPSGYPLYLLWLRATSWIPAESPAHAAAIATAVLASIQVLVLHAACRAWGARASAASLAVAIFAAGPAVLRIHTEAEVFALNGLIVALVLWLAAAGGPLRGASRAFALGLVAGLGLSNHLTCVLAAPVGILGVVRGVREGRTHALASVGVAALGLAIGLSAYVYLIITNDSLLSWKDLDGLGDVVHHFLRKDYGAVGQFSPHGREVSPFTSLLAMAETIARGWLYLPLVLGLGMLAWQLARPRGPESRVGWAMLAVSIVLAGPVLATRFNVMPEGLGLYIVRRFHILPALLLAPAVATALDHIGTLIQRRLQHRWLRSRGFGGVVAVVAFVSVAGLSLPHLLRVHSPAVELGLRNTLRSLPVGAVVFVHSDVMHFGMGYLQGALGERPDVIVIMWPQVPSPTYRARLARRAGIEIVAHDKTITTVAVAEQVLAMKRPVYIDPFNSNIAAAFPTYPYGVLFRVLPRGHAPPPIEEVFALNRSLFENFDLSYPVPGLVDDHATDLHQHYERVWRIIAQGLEVAGRREELAIARTFADALAPKEP